MRAYASILLGTAGGAARVAAAPLALADLAWRAAGGAWALVIIGLAVCWLATRMPMIASAAAASAKAYAVESRLNELIPKIPAPQPAPGTTAGGVGAGSNSSYSGSNSSYSTSNSSYSDSDGGQGAAPTTYSQGTMQGAITRINNLIDGHNALQGSYSNTIPAFNALQASHSNLVPAFNALQGSHSSLVPVVNNLVSDHAQLITDHNNLKQAVINSGLLH